MFKQDDLSADHITWLVKSRSANQELTLKLYLVMKDNAEALKKNWPLANNAQALVGASFSLWRAVFLSDISDQGWNETVADAQSFLGNLVLHNMVAYQQDRSTRDNCGRRLIHKPTPWICSGEEYMLSAKQHKVAK